MPCCLTILLAIMIPRVMIVILWLFTNWFSGIFTSIIWPILGFLFLPASLLWYTAVHNWYGGEWGALQILIMVVAVIFDISPGGGHSRVLGVFRKRRA